MNDYRYNQNNNYPNTSNRTPANSNRPVQGRPVQGRPVQGMPVQRRPIERMPVQGRPVQGRPVQNSSTMIPSTNRQLQNNTVPGLEQQNAYQEGFGSREEFPSYTGSLTEGPMDKETVYSIDGTYSHECSTVQEGSHSHEGSEGVEGQNNKSVQKKQLQKNKVQTPVTPPPQKSLLDFSDMDNEEVLRGLVLSEILGKPKALRRGRW